MTKETRSIRAREVLLCTILYQVGPLHDSLLHWETNVSRTKNDEAQLRSNVYLALEDPKGGKEVSQRSSEINQALQSYSKSTDGRLVLHLIREFLAFFNLNFTLSIFEPEALEACGLGMKSRGQLIEGLGLNELTNPKLPLLAEILRLSKVSVLKSETPTLSERTEDESPNTSSIESGLTQKSSLFRDKSNPDISQPASNASTPFSSLNLSRGGIDHASKSPMKETPPASETNNLGKTKETDSKAGSTFKSSIPRSALNSGRIGLDSGSTGRSRSSLSKESPPSSSESLSNLSNPKDSFEGKMDTEPVTMIAQESKRDLHEKKSPNAGSSLSDLPKLGHSSLGNLPPLGGGLAAGSGRRSLAPLKKVPSISDELSKVDDKILTNTTEKTEPTVQSEPATKPPASKTQSSLFSAKSQIEDPVREQNNEEDNAIDEEIDEFLNSSGPSASEDFTKDETVSEEDSLRVDYKEAI
ncbi:centrosomal protein 43-like isoform X2 [Tigriopus californicus]|uniref:centrosomal protein 43-like isoform X2 n=1 Tax=Tigriopus californicus TaxID=6832 RepID=UPI0027D9E832|nr:centrosomal protein 43-like isoform X2 [Tigriopus californicus]